MKPVEIYTSLNDVECAEMWMLLQGHDLNLYKEWQIVGFGMNHIDATHYMNIKGEIKSIDGFKENFPLLCKRKFKIRKATSKDIGNPYVYVSNFDMKTTLVGIKHRDYSIGELGAVVFDKFVVKINNSEEPSIWPYAFVEEEMSVHNYFNVENE